MLHSKHISVFISVVLAIFNSAAQLKTGIPNTEKFRAVHWGLDDGLSQGEVYSMLKDINGFLWIATPFGLNRFDGSSFKKYVADKAKKNKTIIGNGTQGLKEDSLHNIWIGTNKGVSVYDTRVDTFRNISSESPGDAIIPFWATLDEVFCYDYPKHQLAAYNIHSLAKRTLTKITPTDTVGYGVSAQYAIFDAGSNCIWLEKGYRGLGGGLLQVSLGDGKRKEFNWPCYKKIPNHSHNSEGMRYDHKRNSIWISSPDGLMEFTLNDKKFHHVDALNELVNQKDFWQWAGIDIDPRGRVWMGTRPAGIIIYDPANNSVSLPFPNGSVEQENVSDQNVSLYCDKDGMVWSGFFSKKGIYQLIPFSPAVKHYVADAGHVPSLTNNIVFNCINADRGVLWMGSPFGIKIFNPHAGFVNLLQAEDLPGIKGGESFLIPINVDTVGKKAWIAGGVGLFEMDLVSKKCSVVMYEDSNGIRVPLKSVLAHHPDPMYVWPYKNGCIIGASLPDHIEILAVNADDPVARKILSFPNETVDYLKVFTNDDNLLFLRRPNDTTNLTYAYHDNKWVRTPAPPDSIQWSKIFYNKTDKTYWIITETQLTQYDKNFRVIRTYTNEDGMPGVKIHRLIPDNKGNIWFITDRSIFQLNTTTGTITMLAEKDGFLPRNFDELPRDTKDDYGDLYIPDDAGFSRISPDKYVSSASTVYFESLKINQKIFPLSAGISHVEELSLKYFENNIVIETGIIDYYSKGKGQIRYKLEAEGKKTGWQYAPAYYTLRYEELPPGKYRLILQSSNAANEFNGPMKSLLVIISPPFWQTWWFRILAALVVVGAIYGWVRYRSHDLKKRNVLLEKKVNERTNELNNSLSTLKNTQDQLVHSEKMASLGELTSGIAHEIKNPLNFINNFSELNLDLITEMENQPNKDPEAAQFLKTLKKNSEKINHHGKRVDDIVKSMLQHSRIGNLTKEPVNINVLCEESLKLAYHGFKAKEKTFQASFETHFDAGLPQIMAVPQDVSRVLLNLFNNAFYAVHEKKKKFQPVSNDALVIESSYKPRVTVRTKKCGDNKISIAISDNGPGIPQKIISKIFQPFFTTKPAGEGTGLGLSMSYDIITKSHNGELNARSIEDEGTDFEIILPVQ